MAAARQPLTDDDVVHGFAKYPIVWMHTGDDRLICSACGRAFSITASPLVLPLLERLNNVGDVEFEATPDE